MVAYDRWLRAGDVPVHVLATEVSSSTWLALWPGLGGTADEFSHLLAEAPTQCVNILALDPPGHGASPPTSQLEAKTIYGIWDALCRHMEGQGAARILIGGHSYGAYAALMAADALLPRLQGLVLVDGGYLDPFPTYQRDQVKAQNLAYLTSRNFRSWDEFLEQERREAGSWDAAVETMVRQTMQEVDGRIVPIISLDTSMQVCDVLSSFKVEALPHLPLPTLLLCATRPAEMNNERQLGTAALSQAIAPLSVQWIPDSGHELFIDNPRETADKIWAFLRTTNN